MLARLTPPAFAALLALSSVGCASHRNTTIVSGASQGTYAVDYPEKLSETVSKIQGRETAVRASMGNFARYPDALNNPKWDLVQGVYDRAHVGGRSAGFVQERRDLERARDFWNDERKDISGKVAGSVQYAAGNCKVDPGVVGGSLKDAVDKRIEERLHSRSDAFLFIDRHRAALGKDNATTLEKQADELSEATYGVYVDLVDSRYRLRAMIADGDSVGRTMDDYVVQEAAYQNEAGRTPDEKKASGDRVATMQKSKAALGSALDAAKQLDKNLDADLDKLTKDFEAAYAQLAQNVKAKKK